MTSSKFEEQIEFKNVSNFRENILDFKAYLILKRYDICCQRLYFHGFAFYKLEKDHKMGLC